MRGETREEQKHVEKFNNFWTHFCKMFSLFLSAQLKLTGQIIQVKLIIVCVKNLEYYLARV